jgi:hypothetical protein
MWVCNLVSRIDGITYAEVDQEQDAEGGSRMLEKNLDFCNDELHDLYSAKYYWDDQINEAHKPRDYYTCDANLNQFPIESSG